MEQLGWDGGIKNQIHRNLNGNQVRTAWSYEAPTLRQVSQIKAPFLLNTAYTQNSFRKPLWNLTGQLGP